MIELNIKFEEEAKHRRIDFAIFLCTVLIIVILYILGQLEVGVHLSDDAQERLVTSSTVIDRAPKSEIESEEANIIMKKLDVPMVCQYPELPTGCEATALTMVLNYYGYDIDKVALVDGYLQYWRNDYQVGFKGSPFSEDGALMWPPAIVDTANIFLEQMKSEHTAEDVSGKAFDEFFQYINRGIPIILWVNETFTTNISFDGTVDNYNGQTYHSHWGSHCVVLTGYDEDRAVAYINNPQTDRTEIDLYQLWSVYDACGRCAVIIE